MNVYNQDSIVLERPFDRNKMEPLTLKEDDDESITIYEESC